MKLTFIKDVRSDVLLIYFVFWHSL